MSRNTKRLADEYSEFVSAYNATVAAEGLPLSEWQTLTAEDGATQDAPTYRADTGALTQSQISQIRAQAPKINVGIVRSSIVE